MLNLEATTTSISYKLNFQILLQLFILMAKGLYLMASEVVPFDFILCALPFFTYHLEATNKKKIIFLKSMTKNKYLRVNDSERPLFDLVLFYFYFF